MNYDELKMADSEIFNAMGNETRRQMYNLELIPSENFVSSAVMQAMGSPLTNKYAEGYPSRRYYGGCEYVDIVEQIAIDRAKIIYNADHANVQPHSGSQANVAVYFGMLNSGDIILGMNLSHGGHLTHGSPVNISGTYFNFVSYGVNNKTHLIDYDNVREIAIEHKPKMIITGATAYSRTIDFKKFKEIADEVGAYLMVDMAHFAGLVAAGVYPNPVNYADIVTTTTHKTLRGPRGGMILCKNEHSKQIDRGVFPGTQGGPLMHVIAAKAVCFKEAMTKEFKLYAQQIVNNAKVLSDALIKEGHNIISGGTDTHLMIIDLRNIGLTGEEAEELLDEVGITCNKNTIPFDSQSPSIASGIRLGTPAITTRGMKEEEMKEIARLISKTIKKETGYKRYVIDKVKELCERFPLYQQLI